MNAPTIPVTDNVADLDSRITENEFPKVMISRFPGHRAQCLPMSSTQRKLIFGLLENGRARVDTAADRHGDRPNASQIDQPGPIHLHRQHEGARSDNHQRSGQ